MSQVLLPSPTPESLTRESGITSPPPGVLLGPGWEPVLEGLGGSYSKSTDFNLNQALACPEAENSHESGTKWPLAGTAVKRTPGRGVGGEHTCWSPANQTRGPLA